MVNWFNLKKLCYNKNMNRFGVSQKIVIFNREGKLLSIRRSKTAPTRPLCWDLPGGDLDFGEEPLASIKREIKEETGLMVKNIKPFDVEAHINSADDFWVTIAYRACNVAGKVILSYEHDQFQWLTPQ